MSMIILFKVTFKVCVSLIDYVLKPNCTKCAFSFYVYSFTLDVGQINISKMPEGLRGANEATVNCIPHLRVNK